MFPKEKFSSNAIQEKLDKRLSLLPRIADFLLETYKSLGTMTARQKKRLTLGASIAAFNILQACGSTQGHEAEESIKNSIEQRQNFSEDEMEENFTRLIEALTALVENIPEDEQIHDGEISTDNSTTPSTTESGTSSVSPSTPGSINPSVSPSNPGSVNPSVSPSNPGSVSPSTPGSISPSTTPSMPGSISPSVSPSNPGSITPSVSPSNITPSVSPSVQPSAEFQSGYVAGQYYEQSEKYRVIWMSVRDMLPTQIEESVRGDYAYFIVSTIDSMTLSGIDYKLQDYINVIVQLLPPEVENKAEVAQEIILQIVAHAY